MSIYVSTAAASTYLQGILNRNTTAYGKAMEQLSSGSKFTSVGDDPIGVTKTAKVGIKIDVNEVVSDNVSIGNDLLSTADSAETSVMTNLQRVRDLTLQISNQVYATIDRNAIINEMRARLVAIDYIAESTSFTGVKLLDGTAGNLTLQIGSASSATLDIGSALIDVHSSALGGDLTLGPGVTGNTWTEADATAYLDKVDIAMAQITKAQGEAGGYVKRLEYAAETLDSTKNNLISLKSDISDVDIATASSELVKYQVLQSASASVLTQTNQIGALALKLLQD